MLYMIIEWPHLVAALSHECWRGVNFQGEKQALGLRFSKTQAWRGLPLMRGSDASKCGALPESFSCNVGAHSLLCRLLAVAPAVEGPPTCMSRRHRLRKDCCELIAACFTDSFPTPDKAIYERFLCLSVTTHILVSSAGMPQGPLKKLSWKPSGRVSGCTA